MNYLDLPPKGHKQFMEDFRAALVNLLEEWSLSGSILGEYDLYTELDETLERELTNGLKRRKEYRELLDRFVKRESQQ